MATVGDTPPVLPPLVFNESGNHPTVCWPGSLLSRSASLPTYSVSVRPPPLYNEHGAGGEEFHTIPLHDFPSVNPALDKRGSILIALFLFLALLTFTVGLAVLLSTTYRQPSMEYPGLFFAMLGLLTISAVLFAKGMSLWLGERARRNAALEPSGAKEVKLVDGYIVEIVEKPKHALITKQQRGS